MSQNGDPLKGGNSRSPSPPLSSIKGGGLIFGPPGLQSTRQPDSDTSLLGGYLVPTLASPPPRAEGRAGADPMSHVLGLQLMREAPPLLGPLLSPFPLPLVPGAARCCAAIPSPVRRGKVPLEAPARTGDAGETWGSSRQVATWVRAGPEPWRVSLAGEADLGQHSGKRRGGGRGGQQGRELPGEGRGAALFQEFPGIKLQRWRRESRVGREALRRTGPLAPSCSTH